MVLLHWQKAHWMSNPELAKELKRFYSTCLSYDSELVVIDGDGSIAESKLIFGFKVVNSLAEGLPEDKFPIVLEPKTTLNEGKDLLEFEHPINAVYIIWSEYGTVPVEELSNYLCVSIESLDARPLWGVIALGILLYDRMIKWQ
jgi:hypothetical protein